MRRILARAAMGGIVILLVFGAIAVVLWAGGRGVIAGEISPGDLSAFIFYAVTVAAAVGSVSEVMGDLQRAAGATERLVELLETQPDIAAPANPKPMPVPAQGSVVFDNVTFHYPSRPDTAELHGLNLTVSPGEHVALVGPSGAGKSTVFQCCCAFTTRRPEQFASTGWICGKSFARRPFAHRHRGARSGHFRRRCDGEYSLWTTERQRRRSHRSSGSRGCDGIDPQAAGRNEKLSW